MLTLYKENGGGVDDMETGVVVEDEGLGGQEGGETRVEM